MAENASPKAAAKTKPARSHPTLYIMVLESLKSNKSAKGLTLQAIKRYTTETYPETKENFSNLRLRNAITKGLENNEIIRTKSTEHDGFRGHFLLNRSLISQNEQEKKKKAAKPAKEGKTVKSPKPDKPKKSPAKLKSTPTKKTAKPASKVSKKTTPKKAPAKSTAKSPKAKKAKSTIKTPKRSKADAAETKTKSASVKKVVKKKVATKAGTKASKK